MKIAFLGTPKIAAIVLEKLIGSQFKPQLVITGHDKNLGRGQALKATQVKLEAQKSNIRISYKISDIDKSFDLAILVAYGKIIPKKILEIPKLGFLNIHPSILPKYRGPSPTQSAILEDETKTGITIIKLDQVLDHGPILAQQELSIHSTDTHETLANKLAIAGAEKLIQILPLYLKGNLEPKPQDNSKATYTQKIAKKSGYINLENPPNPQKLDRMIHAFYPWPGTWCRLIVNGKWLIVKFLPPTIPQSYNPTDPFLIQLEGKRPMTIKEFLNGYPEFKNQLEKLVKQ